MSSATDDIEAKLPSNLSMDAKEKEEMISKKSSPSIAEIDILPSNEGTLEYPPMIDFYENSSKSKNDRLQRPSITELVHGNRRSNDGNFEYYEEANVKIIQSQLKPTKMTTNVTDDESVDKNEDEANSEATKKFGWIEGVLIRCCANTFGVMLYLRMAWVAGQAGILMGSLIVLLGSFVTLITALSMSAICSNGLVKGGGAYYLISRSLGPQFGGAIGIIFSLANAVGVAMYVVGFAETIVQLLNSYGISIIDGSINDVRIIGIVTCILLLAIIFIGLGFEAKMQIVLLIIVVSSIITFYIGCIIPPSDEKKLMGMTGFKTSTFVENFFPSFRNHYYFASVFAIYFPAATGIMAGANISGDLKNSSTAIPKGTILGIFLTTIVYLSIVWITGSTVVRDADGITFPNFLDNPTSISNDGSWISSIFSSAFGNGTQYYAKPTCAFDNNKTCEYGIMNDAQVFNLISLWSPLVIAGVLTSTLSSALLSLVAAPKIFQAVAQDKLFPYIETFSTGFRNSKQPQKAYILAFFISCLVVLVGNLNAIAPIISNFYLSTYTLINFACFDTSFVQSPGFRPSFRYYHQWVSLIGAILCVCIMFVISYMNALITFMFFGLLFFYMSKRKPDVNWGTSKQAHVYRNAFLYIQKLEKINEHVKNYRPQILVLSGNPASRPSLVDFGHSITKGQSLLICGHVIQHDVSDSVNMFIQNISEQIRSWFHGRNLKAIYFPAADNDFQKGIQFLIQGAGLGKLKPNILLIGFRHSWEIEGINGLNKINDYFNIIISAFDSQMGVCILRNSSHGLNFSNFILKNHMEAKDYTENGNLKWSKKVKNALKGTKELTNKNHKIENCSNSSVNSTGGNDESENQKTLPKHLTPEQTEILHSLNQFRTTVENGTIDVWWLYDDGGLALLLPYLLTQNRSYLEGARLRIFTVSNHPSSSENEEKELAALLSKFRIQFDEITVVKNDDKDPKPETISEFEKLIQPFYIGSENDEFQEGLILEAELENNKDKTKRILKMSEFLRTYSSESNLVVITLPVPREGTTSSCLYMTWIDIMTRNLPPSLLVRGNHSSVLTLYS